MEKETFDFSAAKVGDLVSNPTFGKGKISNVDNVVRPIQVTFNNRDSYFTFDGRINIGYPQSLYHGHVDFVITPVEPCPYEVGDDIAVEDDGVWVIKTFKYMDIHYVYDTNGDVWSKHRPLSSFNQKEV